MDSIHTRIRKSRLALGLSLEQVAKELGVTYQAVQQWEREPDPNNPARSSAPSSKRLSALAALLQKTETWLLTGKDPQGGNLDPIKQQMVQLYDDVPEEFQEAMIQSVNQIWALAKRGSPPSVGDPYSGKRPPRKR